MYLAWIKHQKRCMKEESYDGHSSGMLQCMFKESPSENCRVPMAWCTHGAQYSIIRGADLNM